MKRYIIITGLLLCFKLNTFSQDFWWTTPCTTGGYYLYSLVVSNSGTILGGTPGKIYRSTDNGASWVWVQPNWLSDIYALAVNRQNNYLYGGMWGFGVRRSTDDGLTWSNTSLNSVHIFNIVVAPNGYVFAAYRTSGANGVYRSTNDGANWSVCFSAPFAVRGLATDKLGNIYAGTYDYGSYYGGQIFKSTDNGVTWEMISNVSNWSSVRGIAVDTNLVLYCFQNNSFGNSAFRSTDGGANWTNLGVSMYAGNETIPCVVNYANEVYVASSSSGVYKIHDSTSPMVQVNSGLSSTNIYSLALAPNQYLFAGTDNGVLNRTTISTAPVPPVPALISPANNGSNITVIPIIDWSDAIYALKYRLQVSTSDLFTTTVLDTSNLTSSSFSVPAGILSNGVIYYWRVCSSNDAGTSSWSGNWNFTTILSQYYISATANPVSGGTASGTSYYISGQTATVVGTHASGWVFANWTESSNNVSYLASYPFVVSAPRFLTANFLNATYPAPSNLQAIVSGNSVRISWNAPTIALGLTGFNVYRNSVKITSTPTTNEYYNDNGLVANTYSYTVKSVFGTTESVAVGPVTATIVSNPGPTTIAGIKGSLYDSIVHVPITVRNFTNISAISLRLDYDTTVLTYTGFSNLNSQLSGLIINDVHVSSALHKLMISWANLTAQTLPFNTQILTLDFTYLSGTTALTWNNGAHSGAECEYADANGNPLNDSPTSTFYINGEVHFQSGYKLKGTIKYFNTANTILDNVKMILKSGGTQVDSTISNIIGYFEFDTVPNNTYTIHVTPLTKTWGGVNATDAVKVQRHFTGLEVITEPVKLNAADVNLSYSINSTDAVKIKRRWACLDTNFLRGDWTIAKPGLTGDTIIINGDDRTQNYYGLCVGDVNASYVPASGKSSGDNVTITQQGELEVRPGEEFLLPLRILEEHVISAMSLTLLYPEDYIEISDVTTMQGDIIFSAVKGRLRIAWSEMASLILSEGEVLLTLRVKLLPETPVGELIIFQSGDDSEIADAMGDAIENVNLVACGIKISAPFNVGEPYNTVQSFNCYPVPAKDKLTFEIVLTKEADISLEITGIMGNLLLLKSFGIQKEGVFKNNLDLSTISNGIYIVRVKAVDHDIPFYLYRKIVINK
jgi:photosystem II stability/assembly factor-like uncharacterized protein